VAGLPQYWLAFPNFATWPRPKLKSHMVLKSMIHFITDTTRQLTFLDYMVFTGRVRWKVYLWVKRHRYYGIISFGICASLARLEMRVPQIFLSFPATFCLLAFWFKKSVFESDCRVGVLNSAFPGRAEPSDLTLGGTIRKIYRMELLCVWWVCLRGWFYSPREPKNIRVPPKFVIHSFVWLFSSQ
jgi:hypothetical protein